MRMQRLTFGVFYWLGVTPWDGHALPARLRELAEGRNRLSPSRALDIGCGTGDASIYLARHGWNVTGVDFVKRALARARKKAAAARLDVFFLHADATTLASYNMGEFQLVIDHGCLHGLTDDGRAAYVRDVTAIVPPSGRLILAGFSEGQRRGPRGFNRAEIERRFSRDWELLEAKVDAGVSNVANDPITVYDLRRRESRLMSD